MTDTKTCTKCFVDKAFTEFARKKSGRRGCAAICKECARPWFRSYYAANTRKRRHCSITAKNARKAWFKSLKASLECIQCGEKHSACLDFHHRNYSEKSFTIGKGVNACYSKATILAEIAKCDILCCNCHRKLHYVDNDATKSILHH